MRRLLVMLAFVALAASARAADDPGETPIVDRATWHARAPLASISRYDEYGLRRPAYTRIVLHVTSMGRGTGAREAQRIQDFHMDARGFADIGYNYLVDSAGTIFEGRSLDDVPAHAGRTIEGDARHDVTLDPDYGSIGVVFSADTDQALTAAQVSAGIALVGRLKALHPIESVITHTEVGQSIAERGLTPEGDFDPADCPGRGSVEQVIAIRRSADPAFDADAYRALFE